MDKTILKNFAVNSRNKLIEDTIYRLSLLGITEDEIKEKIENEGFRQKEEKSLSGLSIIGC